MPTGYTHGVQDGTVTEFRDFALICARAFGATILMRDDPMDAPIPDEFQSSTYHLDRLKELEIEQSAQLRESIDFDCSTRYETEPVLKSGKEWLESRRQIVARDIACNTKQHEEEVHRTNERNRWIRQLRESLK